jgi:hypothetical protein
MSDTIRASSEWHFLTRYPPQFLDKPLLMDLYGNWVRESLDACPSFASNLRDAALLAIDDGNTILLRKALQALAHVGQPDDVPRLKRLVAHPEPLVARDAKTCVFQITHQ